MVQESGEHVVNKRVVKGTLKIAPKHCFNKYDEKFKDSQEIKLQLASRIAEDIISNDPEIDVELTGKFIEMYQEYL